jgi:DNA-binding PadR family transcriptional regulator
MTPRFFPRLSATERLILELLRGTELFGLQLVERSDGALKRGTVYVTLGRMQEKRYVESRTEPLQPGAIGLPRRWYRPTPYGLKVLDAWGLAAQALADAGLSELGAQTYNDAPRRSDGGAGEDSRKVDDIRPIHHVDGINLKA